MIGCRRAAFEGSKSNSSVWTRLAASGRLFLFFGFALAGWAGGIPNPKVPRATKVLLVQTPPQLERENVFPKGRFTRELGDASGVSSSVYIFFYCNFSETFLATLSEKSQIWHGSSISWETLWVKIFVFRVKTGGSYKGSKIATFHTFPLPKITVFGPSEREAVLLHSS